MTFIEYSIKVAFLLQQRYNFNDDEYDEFVEFAGWKYREAIRIAYKDRIPANTFVHSLHAFIK